MQSLRGNVAQVLHVRNGTVTDAWIHHTDQSSVDFGSKQEAGAVRPGLLFGSAD
jgi:hypothetical protein